MSLKLNEGAQLHRHLFTTSDGVPPPPLAAGKFRDVVATWLQQPLPEQPFYFISLDDGGDVGYEVIRRYDDARKERRSREELCC